MFLINARRRKSRDSNSRRLIDEPVAEQPANSLTVSQTQTEPSAPSPGFLPRPPECVCVCETHCVLDDEMLTETSEQPQISHGPGSGLFP